MFVVCHISVNNVFIVHSVVQLLSNLECPPFPSNPVQSAVPFWANTSLFDLFSSYVAVHWKPGPH